MMDHFLWRLETIIAKTVLIGSCVSRVGAMILPPYTQSLNAMHFTNLDDDVHDVSFFK